MINAYDQPAQASFMQTYVPMPFEEMAAAGASHQKRWDENELLPTTAETTLEKIKSLDQINAGLYGNVEVGDRKRVKAKQDEYNLRIEGLSKFSDKASPEFRSEAIKIITDLRRDTAQDGVFGGAEANYTAYQNMLKERKEAKIGGKAHRALYQDKLLKQFGESSLEGNAALSSSVDILPDIDINSRIVDQLKNIKDSLLREGTLTPTQYDELLKKGGDLSGVKFGTAFEIAKQAIFTSPDLLADIQAQAEASGTKVEDVIASYATVGGNTFARQTKDNDQIIKDDQTARANEREEENQTNFFAAEHALPTTGNNLSNSSALEGAIQTRQQAITSAQETAKVEFVKDWNIPAELIVTDPTTGLISIDSEGTTDRDLKTNIGSVGVQRLVFLKNEQIKQNQKALRDAEAIKNNAMLEAGISEDDLVKEAKDKTRREAENIFLAVPGRTKEQYDADIEGYVEKNYSTKLQTSPSRNKKYNTALKKQSEEGTSSVAVVNVDPKTSKYMEEYGRTFGVTSASASFADTQNGIRELTPKERAEYLGNIEYPAKFGGFYTDPNDGTKKALYTVYDDKGKAKAKVSTTPPLGIENHLYKTGAMEELTSYIQSKVYNSVDGVLNKAKSGVGELDITESFRPVIVGTADDGSINVSIKVKRGDKEGNEIVSFPNQQALITALTQLAKGNTAEVNKK